MQERDSRKAILRLASTIADLLTQHPNPREAETACAIAKELAGHRVRQCSSLRIRTDHRLK